MYQRNPEWGGTGSVSSTVSWVRVTSLTRWRTTVGETLTRVLVSVRSHRVRTSSSTNSFPGERVDPTRRTSATLEETGVDPCRTGPGFDRSPGSRSMGDLGS